MGRFFITFLILITLLLPQTAVSAEGKKLEMKLAPEGIYIENINAAVLQKLFADYKYNDYIYTPDWKYPPLFVKSMPEDFNKIKDKNLRNRLFIQIMVPLAMYANEQIMLERYDLLLLQKRHRQNEKFLVEDEELLEKMAGKYDIFTRMKGKERYEIIMNELMERVDTVPPSMLIAVAAAESNWGTAREVSLGNALYKEKVWNTDEGIKPLKDEDDSYRIKIHPSLQNAIDSYALKLNSDVNFAQFRNLRMQKRKHNKDLRGNSMVYNMVLGSPLENYAGLISYIVTFYDLVNLDEAELGSVKMLLEKK